MIKKSIIVLLSFLSSPRPTTDTPTRRPKKLEPEKDVLSISKSKEEGEVSGREILTLLDDDEETAIPENGGNVHFCLMDFYLYCITSPLHEYR